MLHTFSAQDEIARGVALHRAGQLAEAEAVWRGVLDTHPDHPEALHLLGLAAKQGGRLDVALALIDKAVRISPDNAVFRSNFGIVLALSRRSEEAIAAFQEALRLRPGYADAAYNLGCALLNTGRAEAAVEAFDQALAVKPNAAEAHYNRGNALMRCGRRTDALAAYEAALRLRPNYVQALANRGVALSELGRIEKAIAVFGEVLRLKPDYAGAHYNRGNAFKKLGDWQRSLEDYEQALKHKPDDPVTHNNRGAVLRALGRYHEAVEAYVETIRLKPDHTEAYYNLGNVLRQCGSLNEAVAAYDQALQRRPDYAEAHYARGRAFKDQGKLGEARDAYDQAIRLRPGWFRAYEGRAVVLRRQGYTKRALADLDEALRLEPGSVNAHGLRASVLTDEARFDEAREAYEKALSLAPDDADIRTNYVLFLCYDPAQTNETVLDAHRVWGRHHGHPPDRYTSYANSPDPDRPIRVGLVSADFGRHPVGYLLDGIMEAVDRRQLHIFCYSGRLKEDDLTARFQEHAHGWRRMTGLSDHALAEMIRDDGIDILIDLSGHTDGRRLQCFALKPAPVQVTWMGYCGTTGLSAIDYILMDPHHVPPGDERWFTETVVRLPDGHWCYSPPDYAPDVTDPPALRNGHITFCSFNNLKKLNAQVIDLWAAILREVPRSRLVLKWPALADVDHRQRLTTAFEARGIASDRLELRTASPNAELLAQYADIDIALDPFPYSGGVTSCEVLWMGLPIVTWPLDRPASRQTLSQLTALGRLEWAARDAEDYVRIAVDLASDVSRLRAMRREQRSRMAASPLCDRNRFARNVESALRQMWRNWCAEQTSAFATSDEK